MWPLRGVRVGYDRYDGALVIADGEDGIIVGRGSLSECWIAIISIGIPAVSGRR